MLDDWDIYDKKYTLDADGTCSIIAPFWKYFSEQLSTEMYDAVTGRNFNALNLDTFYWKDRKLTSKLNVRAGAIMCELCLLTMKYATIKAIIYESNPKSLIPITSYIPSEYKESKFTIANPINSGYVFEQMNGGFWISEEYLDEVSNSNRLQIEDAES